MFPIRFSVIILCALSACSAGFASDPAKDEEDESLNRALSGTDASETAFIHAIEEHLAKFPKTARRAELERALLEASIDAHDNQRIIQYGERVLGRDTAELKMIEAVATAMLATGDQQHAGRALEFARRYEAGIRDFEKGPTSGHVPSAKMRDHVDQAYSRAFLLEARALAITGPMNQALDVARKSYSTYPSAAAARELAVLLAKAGQEQESVRYYAEAFTIPDEHASDADRASDRLRMGELYRKLKGSEAGLGDIVLEAYDRATAMIRQRDLKLKQLDPNAKVTDPMQFTLTGLDGSKLALTSLKGKIVVMDFWATWCGPCRVQHGLYEQVKKRFHDRPEVVFLSINTDEDRDTVPEFIAENGWDKKVYFEDGLASTMQIDSLPTAILINKRGEIARRMNGFVPQSFVDEISGQITEALNQ